MTWIRRILGSTVSRPTQSTVDVPRGVVEDQSGRIAGRSAYVFSDKKVRIAAIGDIHGRLDLLKQLEPTLNVAARDPNRRLIEIYMGDYIDRGPDSAGVIDFLMNRRKLTDRDVICLAGNHEQIFMQALGADDQLEYWLGFGGQNTMLSYGISARRTQSTADMRQTLMNAVPASHLDFYESLDLFYFHKEFFFAHAGVQPGVKLEEQSARDLLWIRGPFLRSFANFGATVVHGHTPTRAPEFRRNRIGIDTGAYQTGLLTALLVTSDAVTTFDNTTAQRKAAELEAEIAASA